MVDYMTEFGNFLLESRKDLKLTRVIMAERIGVTKASVQGWELGATLPDDLNLEKIANAYNISLVLLKEKINLARESKTKERSARFPKK